MSTRQRTKTNRILHQFFKQLCTCAAHIRCRGDRPSACYTFKDIGQQAIVKSRFNLDATRHNANFIEDCLRYSEQVNCPLTLELVGVLFVCNQLWISRYSLSLILLINSQPLAILLAESHHSLATQFTSNKSF